MAEGGVGTCPQVFVVDSQANYVSMPSRKKSKWPRVSQKFLLMLVGITMLGLVGEAYLIYKLYKKMEASAHCASYSLCQNLSEPRAASQQGGMTPTKSKSDESNEIPTVQPHPGMVQKRPFAQLIGSMNPLGSNNVVQWLHRDGEAIMSNMGYNNGRLLIEMDGHYYLYSKVTLNAAEECSLIQHKVMKETKAYGQAIDLMRSKSIHCQTSQSAEKKPTGGEDLWNSFLGGIFYLQSGDEIFVTLEDISKIRPGATDNLMGAFMISP